MSFTFTKDNLRFAQMVLKLDFIKGRYGDNYPIILYEPSLNCQEKKVLKKILQGNSSVHLFEEFTKAVEFVQSLGISFILIVSEDFEERAVIKNFRGSEDTSGRAMFDFEEDAMLKDLFPNTLDDVIKSLKLKAYVFITLLDFMSEVFTKEDEEEVMIIPSVEKMAEKFREEYNVIWYDSHLDSANKEAFKQKFDIQERNIYEDFDKLRKRIENFNSTDPPFHLILTGKDKAEEVINEIDKFKDRLLCLYLESDDPKILKMKNRQIFVQDSIEKLIPKITQGIRTKSKLTNSFPAFATNFDALDKSEIYYLHYYLKGLTNFKNRKQAKGDFIKLGKKIYESKKIFEFEQEYEKYNREGIFKWYSMESPVYKLVNNCLRFASHDSILYCRYVLKDLETAIREKYHEESHKFNGVVYRGAYIKDEEWEKLQNNKGKEIEMYGFLSTSQNLKIAKNFFNNDPQNKIFITIIIPPLPNSELNEQGFANISQDSKFKEEAEILFNIRSKFQVAEAWTEINDQGKKCRHLVLMYGTPLLRKEMTKHQPVINVELKPSIEKRCDLCPSASKLFAFNQGMTQVRCHDCLVNKSFPKNTLLLALDSATSENIIKEIKGKILEFDQTVDLPYYGFQCHTCQEIGKVKYYKWINLMTGECFMQCSNCFEKNIDTKCHVLIEPYAIWQEHQAEWEAADDDYQTEISGFVKSDDQGEVYLEAQRFDLCIEYERRCLNILKRRRWREFDKLKGFWIIGKAYARSGNYQKAIEFFTKVSEISKGKNPFLEIASSNGIAAVHEARGELQKALQYRKNSLDSTLEFGNKHRETASSYDSIGKIYARLGQYKEAVEYYKTALDIRESIFGDRHPETAESIHSIASTYKNLGQYREALKYHQKALDIRKNIFGDRHPDTIDSYQKIALAHRILGQHQEALDHFATALNLSKNIFGEEHPTTAESYSHYALACEDLGKYQEALKHQEKALDIRKALFGDNNPATASSYSNYASACKDLGRYQEALDYNKKALDINESILGDSHPDTATAYNNYGRACGSLGRYQEALESQQKALKIMKTVFGESHPETAMYYSNLGSCYHNLRQSQEALKYLKKALEIRIKFLGDKHPETANSYNSLAGIFEDLGQFQEALEFNEKALILRRNTFGDKHNATADSYNNCASIFRIQGKYQKAIEFCQKALDIKKTILGDMHPETDTCENNLAALFADQRESERSLECNSKALEKRTAALGDIHPQTSTSYINSALVFESSGQYKEALKYFKKGLEVTEALFGEKHWETAILHSNIASTYRNLAQYQEALDYQKKALSITQSIYGENHRKTAAAYNNLASTYKFLKRYEEALKYQTKALDLLKTLLGEKHSDTAITYNNVGEMLDILGRSEEALEFHKKALDLTKTINGDQHYLTAASYNNLGMAYQSLKKYKDSEECLKKAVNITELILGKEHPTTAGIKRNLANTCLSMAVQAVENFTKASREGSTQALSENIKKVLREHLTKALNAHIDVEKTPNTMKVLEYLESLLKRFNQK